MKKKLICLALVLVMCLSLAACGTAEAPGNTTCSHNWVDATCIAAKTCTACGETEGNVGDHVYKETARVDATASQNGSVTYTCGTCGDCYEEILPATGSIGLAYEQNSDGTWAVVGIGTCTDSHVVIPSYYEGSKVTAIAQRAFYDCTSITEITIPETVSEIGTQVFYKCSALHTVYYNGSYGRYDNPFLSVANIKKLVFGGSAVPAQICQNATNIEDVVISDSVTSIGHTAFGGCKSLTSVVIPDSVTSIGSYAFVNCSSLTSIAIPDSVTSIEGGAFTRCSSLTSIVIPDSVTSIEYKAFNGCSSLTSVVIPDSVTSIGESAFGGCSSLYDIVIPDSVTFIEGYTFSHCSNLTSIVIPDSVTSIRFCAFFNCSSLTSVVIPDSVITIGEGAFGECSNLTEIHFGGTKAQWEAFGSYLGVPSKCTVYCADGEI